MVTASGAGHHPAVGPAAVSAERAPLAVTVASEHDGDAWDAFVAGHPGATGYHAWRWRTVFQQAFGHETVYLVARRGERVCGVLPLVLIDSLLFGRTLTSLPFVNYGGVVADDGAAGDALLEKAGEVMRARRCRHVELRHVDRRFDSIPCRQHKIAMVLDLPGLAWERLDKKVRNLIRKAQKSNFTCEHGGPELLDGFYAVFARNMRDLGTPVYTRAFFTAVLRAFPHAAHLHVVRLGDKPVAAGLTFRTRETVEIPWASSIRDYNHLCPNYLLYWNMLQFAHDLGCRRFDFGRSTPGEGTHKFKEQWGAAPVPLHWEYLLSAGVDVPDTSPNNPKYEIAIELWKHLPLAVATRVGPYIVRGIP